MIHNFGKPYSNPHGNVYSINPQVESSGRELGVAGTENLEPVGLDLASRISFFLSNYMAWGLCTQPQTVNR